MALDALAELAGRDEEMRLEKEIVQSAKGAMPVIVINRDRC